MKESRHSGRGSCGGSAKQPPPQSSDSLQHQTLWFPTAAAHPTPAAPLGSVMSLSLPHGREGESWKPVLPVSLQGCRGTELFHHRVLPTDTAGLTLATLLPHLHPAQQEGVYGMLHHFKPYQEDRQSRNTNRESSSPLQTSTDLGNYARQGLASSSSLLVFMTFRGLCPVISNPFPEP